MDEERIEPPERREESGESRAAATDNPQDGASAPGVPFAYDITREEIAKQEATIREINSRLGFLLAAALTFASVYFKEPPENAWEQIMFGVVLIAMLILILLGYVPRNYLRAPNPVRVTELANNRPGRIKELALGTMLQACEVNRLVIKKKTQYYSYALRLGVGSVIIGIIAVVAPAIATLRHDNGRHEQQPAAGVHAERRAAAVRAHGRRSAVSPSRNGIDQRRHATDASSEAARNAGATP